MHTQRPRPRRQLHNSQSTYIHSQTHTFAGVSLNTSKPQELLLFISGRDAVRLTFDGEDDAVDTVRAARRAL
jgi:hypothetical protein